MKTGLLTIDFLTLQETNVIQDSTDGLTDRSVQIGGIETTCDTATVELLRDNILGLADRIVPVQFQYKSSYNGFYRVMNVSAATDKWYNSATAVAWQATLKRIGPDNTVDVESRLANIVRANDFSLTGERWHAPAINHRTYFTGSTAGTPLTRVTDAGSITVYRGIPAGVNPRWGVSVANFPAGRVRFFNNGTELLAPRQLLPTTGWELSNGLVRIRPATAGTTTLLVAHYDGTAWREKSWDIRIAGDSLVPATHFTTVNLVRRNHEVAAIRIHAVQPSNGNRVIIDLLVRRGSRSVEGYVQRTTSGDIVVCPDVSEPNTTATGYVIATNEDVDGLRYIVGSAKTFTNSSGGVLRSSTTTLDFWISAEVPQLDIGGISNIGFETGTTTDWTQSNATLTSTTEQAKFGTRSGKLVSTAAAFPSASSLNFGTVTPVAQYRVSGWLFAPTALGSNAFIEIMWRNSSNAIISESVHSAALPVGAWTYFENTYTAPVGAVRAHRYAGIYNAATPVGTVMYVDDLRIRPITDPGDAANVLRDQYIGAMAETTEVVRR